MPGELVSGDLVIFIGYTYTPDYVYREHYAREPELGLVIGVAGGYYHGGMYKVFWLKAGVATEVPAGHLCLAYTDHTSAYLSASL
jgi:hypothetical protein